MARHIRFERASFHTPGHKGRLEQLVGENWLEAARDLTELPGLDELSQPKGVLQTLENDCAKLYNSRHTFLSVNGASAALAAAIIASKNLGRYILLPRNAHRAAVQAAALADLEPIWYEPLWLADWGFWGQTTSGAMESAISAHRQISGKADAIAAAVVVSPTYEGTISDIKKLADFLHERNIALLVDAAHGAHYTGTHELAATNSGADAVAHSLHKTLLGLTQTGLLHLPHASKLNDQALRNALNLITSSSPSYLLLASIEHNIRYMESADGQNLLQHFAALRALLEDRLADKNIELTIYQPPLLSISHILISPQDEDPEALYDFLADRAIFPEAVLGRAVLFMLGAGSDEEDIAVLGDALLDFAASKNLRKESRMPELAKAQKLFKKPELEIELSPHNAITQPVVTLPREEALGKISAECVSPCPPGIPVLIPGQRITEEVLERTENKQFTVVAAPAAS